MEFKAGDSVKLTIPGSPVLTVEEVAGPDVRCHWFDVHGGYHQRLFHASLLEPAEKPKEHEAHHAPAHHAPHKPKVEK